MVNTGILMSYGSAPYKDDPKNNPSYFVELEKDGEIKKVWGVGLEEAMKNTQAKQGDSVVVNNLGNKLVNILDPNNPTHSIQVRRNIWEVEVYEPPKQLTNVIEHHIEREEIQQKDVVNDKYQKPKERLEEFNDYEIPSSLKNNYYVITKNRLLQDEKYNYYDKSDKGAVNIAFEDRKTSLNTSRQDEKTISAMLDLAESKGWSSIKLKGTEEFKQKAWLEASLRGIDTKGYKPSERDLAALKAIQDERSINAVISEKIEKPKENIADKTQEIENEAYVRALEFESGRDIDPDLNTNFEAERERFHENLAAPSIKGVSQEEAMAATERAFDRRVGLAMPKRDDLRMELGINKEDVKHIVQNGYRDGSIKNRDDLVARLQEHGFEIVRQSDKSITLSNPKGKDLRLDGEIFAKDFDALRELKNNLELDNIRKNYPQIKDVQLAQIELQKQQLLNKFTTPQAQQQALHRLHATLPEIAAGRTNLGEPVPPSITNPDIQVRTPNASDKSRSR